MVDPTLVCFPDSARFARSLGRSLGVSAQLLERHAFPDGETLIRARGAIGSEVVLVRSLHDPNAKLVEVLLAADALRRAGARRLTLVAPYLPYMRQDAVFRRGECLSQQVVGQLLGRAFERVIAVEPHLHRTGALGDAIPCEAIAVSAAPVIARWIGKRRPLLVGPDIESEPTLRAIAQQSGLSWAVGRKVRHGDTRVEIELTGAAGHRSALIVDDIASSGATLAQTARALRRAGAQRIDVAVAHAIFAAGALQRLRRAGVHRIVSCDTVPHETNQLRMAARVAEAVLSASAPVQRRDAAT